MKGQKGYVEVEKHSVHIVSELLHKITRWYELHRERALLRCVLMHHRPVAVDIFSDPRDGLLAARHYPVGFPLVEADFDRLPFGSSSFDLVVFNASFHYSSDYARTLAEARRCLRPEGRVVILDSPVYRLSQHGEQMRTERQVFFEQQHGFRSEALRSIEYLDESMLDALARDLRLSWRIHRPWYCAATARRSAR